MTLHVNGTGDKHRGVRFIRVTWVDYGGAIRARIVPAEKVGERNIGLARGVPALGLSDVPAHEDVGFGAYTWTPDWSSFYKLPYLTTPTGSIFGFELHRDPTIQPQGTAICPRAILQRSVDSAKDRFGVSFLVGFELEFVLLESRDPLRFCDDDPLKGYSGLRRLRSGSKALAFAEELYDTLTEMGIEVPLYHQESAPGQLEFPLGPLQPLQAVDQCIAAREAIYNVANKHRLFATFAPMVAQNAPGNGMHVHISLNRSPNDPPVNVNGEIQDAMTLREQQFLAGLVDALPSLIGMTLPSSASYARMKDHMWSGGTYACYGIEHRDTPLRVCWDQTGGPESRRFHIELKQHDGTSNAYLATAALIHAGLLGIEKELQLGPPAPMTVADMPESDRVKLKLDRRLPTNLIAALDTLQANTELIERIGPEAVDLHLMLRRSEHSQWEALPAEERLQQITSWY